MANSQMAYLYQVVKNPYIRKYLSEIWKEGTPVSAVASAGTLTVGAQPTADDTMTVGTKVYTFVANGTASSDGEIDIGTDLAGTQSNIVDAINGDDGINTANTLVSCGDFATNDAVITALVKGVAGNSIATTETFTSASNEFDADTLGTTVAGVNGTIGIAGMKMWDGTKEYTCVADSTISNSNWKSITYDS